MNRTQIYLNDFQHDALVALAKSRSVTASALIRDAIDGYLAAQRSPEERVAALRALGARLELKPQTGESGAEIVERMRQADADRLKFRE